MFLPRMKVISIPPIIKGKEIDILVKIFNPLYSYLYFRIEKFQTPSSNIEVLNIADQNQSPSNEDMKFEFLPPCDFDPDVDDKEMFDRLSSADSPFIIKRSSNFAILKLTVVPSVSYPQPSYVCSFSLIIIIIILTI